MFTFHSIFQGLSDLFFKPDHSFLFCSVSFWVIFIVFFALYIFIRNRRRSMMIAYVILFGLFISWKVNGWGMLIMPATAFLSWYMTEMMKTAGGGKYARRWLTAIIVTDLVPLVYFKYSGFFVGIFDSLFSTNFAPEHLILPVGLSFYTFQVISYSVDVYKERVTYDVSLLEYCFYITFFPLLFAGPITRADTLVPQLRDQRPVDGQLVKLGFWLIILGLLKKGLVADFIADYNNWIFDTPANYSGFEVLMGIIGFYVQIYCDFSGYSDLSIGLAALLGFRLLPNFNFPYKAQNVTDFWHRWHISLSTWFRDYVYIPLGGNRKGTLRTYLNNFVTMLVAGLWHGASWMFVIWGAMHGLGLIIHKACRQLFLDRISDSWPVRTLSIALTTAFVIIAWTFFRAPDMDHVCAIFSQMHHDFSWDYLPVFFKVRTTWSLMVLLIILIHWTVSDKHYKKLKARFISSHWLIKLAVFALTIQLIINFSHESVQPLLYSQF